MYELIYSKVSSKHLRKLDKPVQERIVSGLERIRVRPEAFVTRLVGRPGYKLRVGDYRVILDIDRGRLVILVIEIGHRRNIYKDI
jgi:mRNA interferase RelE/StbE